MRREPRCLVSSVLILGVVACGACGSKKPDTSQAKNELPRAVFAVPSSLSALDGDHFFDHPWPSDLRREADGTVRLDGYVNPREAPLIKTYLRQMKGRLDGFSPAAAGYLAFGATIEIGRAHV